jgi:cystathionine beta-lyase/cystathionine gamma-synthase
MFEKVREGFYHLSSLLIHGRFTSPKWDYTHHVIPPLTSSSTYRLSTAARGARGFQLFGVPPQMDTGPGQDADPIYIYERLDEPTRGMLEERLAFAEGGQGAVCFASGMAAISGALMATARKGQRIIAHRTLYGCTYSLMTNWLPRFGIDVDMVDLNRQDDLERCLDETVAAVYFETPSNPILEIVDIAGVVAKVQAFNQRRADKKRTLVVVDNTFATPFGQRPLKLGADMVVESLTKNICGFGTAMGGAVIYKDHTLLSDLVMIRKDIGASLASAAAWPILVYGLPTLPMRLKQQQESAMAIASFLEKHPKVERVRYPGLKSFPQYRLARDQMRDYEDNFAPGSLLYFVLKGNAEAQRAAGERLINHVAENAYAMTLAVSLGQIRTLIEHPGSMTHAALPAQAQLEAGIDPGGIRISVGNEQVNDILRDLEAALDAV